VSLIRQLGRIIYKERYNDLTFLVNSIPIITVHFFESKEVEMIMNNMEKLKFYDGRFSDDVDKFAKDVETAFIYNGIDEMFKKLRVMKIKFHAERYIDGVIMPNKIIINRGDADIDEKGQEFVLYRRYKITGAIELSSHTLAIIVTALAIPHYF
jgi:hypothetical protein